MQAKHFNIGNYKDIILKMANKNTKATQQQEKVMESVSKTEQFYNENKKIIWGCVIALAVIALAILGYRKFIYEPKAAEAAAQMYPAENAFLNGDFELALNGDGNNLGFIDVIDQYGKKAGKAAYLYAGLCQLNLKNYQEAIDYLKKYKGTEPILASRALVSIGDAYAGLEDYTNAQKYYSEAIKKGDNMFAASYILKLGQVYEELGQTDKALELYKEIEDKYPQSIEAYDIGKYIVRIENSK